MRCLYLHVTDPSNAWRRKVAMWVATAAAAAVVGGCGCVGGGVDVGDELAVGVGMANPQHHHHHHPQWDGGELEGRVEVVDVGGGGDRNFERPQVDVMIDFRSRDHSMLMGVAV